MANYERDDRHVNTSGQNRRKKKKKKGGTGATIALIIIAIVLAAVIFFCIKRFGPSSTMTDLRDYYNLTKSLSEERTEATESELAIILEEDILQTRAISQDGEVFVPLSIIKSNIDDRFYYDSNENWVMTTTATDIIKSTPGTTTYLDNGETVEAGYVIAIESNDEIYLNVKFMDEFSCAHYEVLSDPGRVFIQYKTGTFDYCTAKKNTYIRVLGGIKADVVAKVSKGTKMRVLTNLEDWLEVLDEHGNRGYIQTNAVTDIAAEEAVSDYAEPEYTHICIDEPVNLVWHSVYYEGGNATIYDYTWYMSGVNVICPSWFNFADEEGNLTSYADASYVEYANSIGADVWVMLDNINGESCRNVITYTSKREKVIDTIISAVKEVGATGINIDIEGVTSDLGDDYIEFLRELSVKCRKEGIILSADGYAPYDYNYCYHMDEQSRLCDYVVLMGYDDYLGGDEAGPNAGLIFEKEILDLCSESMDMSRLVVGVPFYTRLWLEYEDGSLGNEVYNMSQTQEIIWQHGLTTEWLSDVGYDYCEYYRDSALVRVWYENANSLDAKLQLISSYNVAGVAAWQLGQETSDVWEVLSRYY